MKVLVTIALALAIATGAVAARAEELTMLASAGGSGRTFAAAAKHFTDATGISIRVIQYPYAEVREKQLLELVGHTGAFDIINVDGSIWLPEVAQYLEPIDETKIDTSHLIPSMVDLFRYDGKLVALPMRIAGWVLIYRKDLFDAAGLKPPTTWTEFRDDAQKLTKDGVYGFAPALRQGNYLVVQWIPILFSHGGKLLNDDKTAAAFNSPQGIKATQFLVDLVKSKLVPPGAATYEQTDIITAISQGIAAMAVTYSPYYLNMNNPKESKVSGKLAIAPTLPFDENSGLKQGHSLISGWGFGVAKGSKHKEDAFKFLQFVTSDAEQKRLAVENDNAPTSKAVYADKDYLHVFDQAPNVSSTLASASDRPLVESWTMLEDILARELSAAVTGSKTVEQALSDAEAAVNGEL
jgi:multiple sugar transport system substrate-binding protein